MPTTWEYQDSRGVWVRGQLEKFSDRGGTDVTYFFRRTTGELDLVSGQRLQDARVVARTAGGE